MFVEQNQTLVFCARNVILTLPVGTQSEQSFVQYCVILGSSMAIFDWQVEGVLECFLCQLKFTELIWYLPKKKKSSKEGKHHLQQNSFLQPAKIKAVVSQYSYSGSGPERHLN